MKKLLTFYFVFSVLTHFSQTIDKTNARQGEDVEYCISHKKMQELLSDPEIRKQYDIDQAQFRQFQKTFKKRSTRGVVYTIPVVFHVLHSGGPENITEDQILDAMAILNRDYRLKNDDVKNVYPDFKDLPSDVEIEFKLATIAPDGTCFKGITRTYTTDTTTKGNNQISIIKNGNDVFKGEWTGSKYLNIFVCKAIGGAAGYTYRPFGDGSSMNNGVWILYNYVGSIGTSAEVKSRALTHEVGHWLGLMHTWGPNNSPGNSASCNDPNQDEIDDTPATVGVTWCNLDEKTCGPRANVENYMDYSYCSKMFTPDQVTRMRASLLSDIGGRSIVASESNLLAVGVTNPSLCKVDFQQSVNTTCPGSTVSFSDISFNNVQQRKWLFPGGIPSESTEINPSVVYNTPGFYTISLTVSDGTNELTKTVQNAVNVYSFANKIPFLESFKGVSDIKKSAIWSIQNPENNQQFQIYKGVGYTDSSSIYLNNFVDKTKSIDALISGAFDLSQVQNQSNITLTFKYAYRKVNKSDDEYFKVYFSSDCGSTWTVKRVISGDALDTNTSVTNWIPSNKSDWKIVNMTNITSGFWNSSMRIKFEFTGSGGNNFFLDDINLYPFAPSDTVIKSTNNTINYDYTIDTVDFFSDQINACLGTEIRFSDKSSVKSTNWKWTFQGAYPTSSIEQNPKVVYTQSGIYDVTLQVGNGTSLKSRTKKAYISVDSKKLTFPILEKFDTLIAFGRNNLWYQLEGKNKVVVDKEKNGNSFAFINRDGLSSDTISFQSKQLDFLSLKDTASVKISFDVSLKGKNKSLMDSISVYLSNDCGMNWSKITTLSGKPFLDSVSNMDSVSTIFWHSVNISNFDKTLLKQFTLLKFSFTGNGDWFIDNIQINGKNTASVAELHQLDFNLFPNPADSKIQIEWFNNRVENIQIVDVIGKVHKQVTIPPNFNSAEINCEELQSGTYFVYLQTEQGVISKPFIVKTKN